ncbi:hypothetical protein H696_04390 [Fonticula alba]|uniref:ABC transmembrane type-1 domain-containing protein n=1 Tax=Fonticula alba TaxID=691883 RepID=A0A058Z411_FONAL|nr:hypothetical protein H696_04390 [Fonticula alba]KCV68970.1 hypothetical protein H696_04390 [Fonticula alba]|eukprot:XP_009496541.1 hypothetical protein H696_04390 [Fonticula alba]
MTAAAPSLPADSIRAYATTANPAPADPAPAPKTTKEARASRSDMKRLFSLLSTEKVKLAILVPCLLGSSLIQSVIPYSTGQVVDMLSTSSSADILQYLTSLGGVFTVGAAVGLVRIITLGYLRESVDRRLRGDVFASTLQQESDFLNSTRSSDVATRLSADVDVVGETLTTNVNDTTRALGQISVGMTMMLYTSPILTAKLAFIVPPVALFAIFFGSYTKRNSTLRQAALARASSFADERLAAASIVQANAQVAREVGTYRNLIGSVYDIGRRVSRIRGVFYSSLGWLANMGIVSALWFGSQEVLAGSITLGGLTSFMIYTGLVGATLKSAQHA